MTLRTRSTLTILVLVLVTALLSWGIASRAILRPFARDVGHAMGLQAVYIADEIDEGARVGRLERALGVEIARHRGPIPVHAREGRIRGRQVWRSRRTVLVETDGGWLEVRRALDTERPARRLPLLLLFPVLIVILIAVWIAGRGLAPLEDATRAMRKVTEGDLDHRLPEAGPRELREAARSFNAMTLRVRRMLHQERELLAGLSHELRTPLTRLQLELSLLEDAGVPTRKLERMRGDLDQLDGLVGEALELSRLQLGARTLTRVPVYLHPLAASFSAVVVSGQGTVLADPRLLRRLLSNLVSNAHKYAPGPVEIHIEGSRFTVRDHGPGVPDADLEHLFDPFYRTQNGSRRAEGLGLGLMIVRQVVDLHGGSVRAVNADPGLAVVIDLAAPQPYSAAGSS